MLLAILKACSALKTPSEIYVPSSRAIVCAASLPPSLRFLTKVSYICFPKSDSKNVVPNWDFPRSYPVVNLVDAGDCAALAASSVAPTLLVIKLMAFILSAVASCCVANSAAASPAFFALEF